MEVEYKEDRVAFSCDYANVSSYIAIFRYCFCDTVAPDSDWFKLLSIDLSGSIERSDDYIKDVCFMGTFTANDSVKRVLDLFVEACGIEPVVYVLIDRDAKSLVSYLKCPSDEHAGYWNLICD